MSNPSTTTSDDANLPAVVSPTIARTPAQQLGDLPPQELAMIATEFGLEPNRYRDPAMLVAAIHDRRQLIARLDRDAMMEVLNWAGRTSPIGAVNEQLAIEIVDCHSMRFTGLNERGLTVLALLRGVPLRGDESRETIIAALKSQEGLFSKLKRKTRGWLGKRVENILGDETTALPESTSAATSTERPARPAETKTKPQALKEEMEDSGIFSGIANRVKRQADSYVNQKLDEIEARIDRKLDEIDRRLAEWRDKEIANRIRILKITLWASVIVAAVSLIYSFIQVEAKQWRTPTRPAPSTTPTSLTAPADSTNNSATTIATRTKSSFTS